MALTGTEVKMGKLLRTNEVCENAEAPTACTANSVYNIPATEKTVIIEFVAGAAGNVVFSKGTGIAGVADLTVAVKKDKSSFICLDTSAFAQTEGDDKGYILMTPAVAGTVSVINVL